MKIAQLISTVSPRFGGPAIGAVALNEAFRTLGHEARLISGDYADHDGRRITQEEVNALPVGAPHLILLPASRPYSLQRSRGMLRTVMRQVRDSDHVHLHGQYEYVQLAALLALLRYRRTLSLQPHGTFEPYQLAQGKLKKRPYHYLIGAWLLRLSTTVLFASQSEADRAALVPPERKAVTPLGVELAPAIPIHGLERWDHTEELASLRVLFLGRLARKKRPEMLIRAWARVARPEGAMLVFVGPDDDWTRTELAAMATGLGVSGSVSFVGEARGSHKTWLYENCGIIALPSDNENFGITVAEAMASGCYCIVTDQVAASAHVVAADSGEVIESDNEKALATAIERALLRPPAAVTAASQRAKNYADRNFSWTRVADKLLNGAHRSIQREPV